MNHPTSDPTTTTSEFRPEESFARRLDDADPLAAFRSRFHIPRRDGKPVVYFAGNSLGLQPVETGDVVRQELEDWANLAVDAHFEGRTPWYPYHEQLREPACSIVGALPEEVVMMNGLTVNLHLMMVSFYRPTAKRHKILMEDCAFPSDTYAVRTQLRYHGHDPERSLILARSEGTGGAVSMDEFERILDREGDQIALILLGGVNYYTGQVFDMKRVAELGRKHGCVVGLDLAHAAGNVNLQLHDWDVDFAVWCSYKYLNGGPGAVAGCFVHGRHLGRQDLVRFGGWWGNDPGRRFRMHLDPEFVPQASADGWQLSNPPILAMAPLRVSLRMFAEAGMDALRAKSIRLTRYLQDWIERAGGERLEVLTPADPADRGCQIAMRALRRPRRLFDALQSAGVVADYREPDAVRIAPVPLYNSFHDVWRFGQALTAWSKIAD